MRIIILLSMFLFLISGCSEPEVLLDYSQIPFEGKAPLKVSVDSTLKMGNGFERRVDLKYMTQFGDTLGVTVLEYESDVFALDYFMNSGRFQGSLPILRGNLMERSIRSDSKIFVFRHDYFRRYERRDFENYIRMVPGLRMGFPQEYLSLPFEHREAGRTSVQTRNFLGVKTSFPVLLQSYNDGNSSWNVARSWGQTSSEEFESWKSQLKIVEPKSIEPDEDVVYFDAGIGINGMAERLPGGRVAVVWGFMDWPDLALKYEVASKRIYEARY